MGGKRYENDILTLPMMPLVSKSIPPLTRESYEPPNRIVCLLDQARACRITFVNGAEGYGKTTLLTEWYRKLKAEGLNVVWFTCDANDLDEDRFWMNFHYAVCTAFEGVGIPSYEELNSMPLSQAVFTLANNLCLAASERGGLYIIVERLDILQGSLSIDSLMMLIGALSDDVHFVLSSRKVYTKYDFSQALGLDTPLVISNSDLALTEEEFACALRERTNRQLDDDLVQIAYRKTLGWPYALNILASLVNVSDETRRTVEAFSGAETHMRDFFLYEVFNPLPPHLQDFLVATSSIGVLNEQLCSYVLDNDDVGDYLNELFISNAFVMPLDSNRQRYICHPLFSDWLSEVKAPQLPRVEWRSLNGRAATWTSKHSMPIAAAKHLILASEQADILNLTACAYPDLPIGDIRKLADFRNVPSFEELHPCFMLLAAWAYAYAADVDNMRLWAHAVRDYGSGEVSDDVSLSLAVLEVKGLCLECRFDEGRKQASEISPLLMGIEHVPLRIMLANCNAEALDHQGMLDLGMEKHKAFASLASFGSFEFLGAINRYEMAYSYFEQGQLTQAAQICKSIIANIVDDHPVLGAAMALEALIGVVQGRWTSGESCLDDARSLVSRKRNVDMFIDWSIARAWAYAYEGRTEMAEAVLLDAMNTVKLSPFAIPRGASVLPFQSRAILSLLGGDEKNAADAYLEFDQLGVPPTAHSAIVRKFVELVLSKDGDIAEQLSSLIDAACGHGYKMLELDLTIELSNYLFTNGLKTKAMRALHGIVGYAAQEEVASPFIWRARFIRPLLVSYASSAKLDYARRSFMKRVLKRPEFSLSEGNEEAFGQVVLTERERDVLELAIEGMTRKEISHELCISESTVKTHLSHMYAKYGVTRFRDLVAVASES